MATTRTKNKANPKIPAQSGRSKANVLSAGYRSKERLIAEIGLSAVHTNAYTARIFASGLIEGITIKQSIGVMQDKVAQVHAGDLSDPEAILTAQAVTLDAMFNSLARCAHASMDHNLQVAEICLKLALKAQSQCRATLETLGNIKNPHSVAFVRQANIAHGPQQVNNGIQPISSRAENSEKPANKLLEECHGQRMDIRAPVAPSRTNQDMAAVGKLDRTQDRGGQKK